MVGKGGKKNGERMGIYSDYLNSKLDIGHIHEERRKCLEDIAKIRKRKVLVMAADLNRHNAPISIGFYAKSNSIWSLSC